VLFCIHSHEWQIVERKIGIQCVTGSHTISLLADAKVAGKQAESVLET